MKITDVKVVLLTGPCSLDPYIGRTRRSASFIEIHTDSGITGIGESYAGYFCPEAVPAIVDFYKPILVNATDPLDVHGLTRRMFVSGLYWGRVGLGAAVISGLESALWDLKGKVLGQPVYQLLGGRHHDRMLCYATGGPSNWPESRLLEKIDFYMSLGFRAFKVGTGWVDHATTKRRPIKSHNEHVETEAAKAELIRRHVGPDVQFMMDGHKGHAWSMDDNWDLSTAKAVLKAVEPYGLFFFEEPLPYDNPWGYGELTRSTSVPVAGGESLTTVQEFRSFADQGAFAIAQPDAAFLGGIGEFLRVAGLFAAQGKRVATHAWGAGAAVMQNIHAGFACPNTAIFELPPAAGELHTAVWGESLQMRDGYILPPEAPGLGVQLPDWLKEKYPFVPGSGEFVSVPGKILEV